MAATAGTTTVQVPLPLHARLQRLRSHARQPLHEVIGRALDALEARTGTRGLDALVDSKRKALRKAAGANRIARLWLFGSRARGESRPDSDVDLLYQADADASLLDIAGFLADAKDILGARVDLANIATLEPAMRDEILGDAVAV